MTYGPLRHAIQFWKLRVAQSELESLSGYRAPGERLPNSINVWREEGAEPHQFRVVDGEREFSLYAAVHPLETLPESAEAVVEIRALDGRHHSWVLWYAEDRCVVLPFDPSEAIEALRCESWVPLKQRTVLPRPILATYYRIKPLLPASLRRLLRAFVARQTDPTQSFLSWPGDQSCDLLMRLVLRLMMMAMGRRTLPFLWFWPEGRPWAAVLTHDVEGVSGLENAERVVELELQRGFRSSFNLVPLDYQVPGSLLDRLRDDGFEVGVHGYTHDGLMFADWSTFLKRVVPVNEFGRRWAASGFRSPATYRNLEWFHLLGFEYDSSVSDTAPLEPQPGGCGSYFPYLVGDLVELPITLPQDHTLYSVLGHTDSEVWLSKLAQIRESAGMACVLTHPDRGPGYIGSPENEARYSEVLDYIAGSGAWAPLPRELVRWWRERLAADVDGLQVDGASWGQATLGEDGALTLSMPIV